MKALLVASSVLCACAAETSPVSTTLSIETGHVVPNLDCDRTDQVRPVRAHTNVWHGRATRRQLERGLLRPSFARHPRRRGRARLRQHRLVAPRCLLRSDRPPVVSAPHRSQATAHRLRQGDALSVIGDRAHSTSSRPADRGDTVFAVPASRTFSTSTPSAARARSRASCEARSRTVRSAARARNPRAASAARGRPCPAPKWRAEPA